MLPKQDVELTKEDGNNLHEDGNLVVDEHLPKVSVRIYPKICRVFLVLPNKKWTQIGPTLSNFFSDISTPRKMNGWNLKITKLFKGKSSEPNLHDFGFHVDFPGYTPLIMSFGDYRLQGLLEGGPQNLFQSEAKQRHGENGFSE